MYAMLAGGGELGGVRLLSQDTIRKASTVQQHPGKNAVMPVDLRWRLGYHGIYTNRGFQKQAYGHFGIGGSGGWAEPDQDLSVALITNGGVKSSVRIGGVAMAAAKARAGRGTVGFAGAARTASFAGA
jgi:CubicO group peptidase (beta-lactamase class C family)